MRRVMDDPVARQRVRVLEHGAQARHLAAGLLMLRVVRPELVGEQVQQEDGPLVGLGVVGRDARGRAGDRGRDGRACGDLPDGEVHGEEHPARRHPGPPPPRRLHGTSSRRLRRVPVRPARPSDPHVTFCMSEAGCRRLDGLRRMARMRRLVGLDLMSEFKRIRAECRLCGL